MKAGDRVRVVSVSIIMSLDIKEGDLGTIIQTDFVDEGVLAMGHYTLVTLDRTGESFFFPQEELELVPKEDQACAN